MFYLELLRQRMLGGNVFWRWEGRKKEKEIKMSDGALNFRKGGWFLFQQELHEYWIRSSGRADTWHLLGLRGEDAVPERGQICDELGLGDDHIERLRTAEWVCCKARQQTVPSPLQNTASLHSCVSA